MSSVVEQWKSQLLNLSSSDRVELAHFLLSSLDPEEDGVEAAWDAEASRRVKDIRAGRATGRPVEELLAELRQRLPVKPFTIHAEAEAEVRSAVAYYEGQREGLGSEFRRAFEEALTRLQRAPQAPVSLDEQGTRKLRLRRFPYTVYYVELDDAIWIAAVAHQKRRPGYWSGRSPLDAEGN